MLFNLLGNKELVQVLLPSEEGLSDLAFEKGWRIKHSCLTIQEAKQYQARFGIPFTDSSNFYKEFLEDEVLPEEECEYLASLVVPYYEETATQVPDYEQEEFEDQSFLYSILDSLEEFEQILP